MLDRYILRLTWWPICLGVFVAVILILFRSGVNDAFIVGSAVNAFFLSVAYSDFVLKEEFSGLQSVGISPRRIGRSLLVVTSVIAVAGIILSDVVQRPIGTEYIGRVFGAAQFPLLADVSLPLSALFRNQQPLATMFFFLCTYFVIVFISRLVANYNNWPMEFAEFIPMCLLIAGDVYLYRRVSLPR